MSSQVEWIPMRQRELERYHTLQLVADHRINGREAAQSLNLSLRHVWRPVARLRREVMGDVMGDVRSEATSQCRVRWRIEPARGDARAASRRGDMGCPPAGNSQSGSTVG
jgi:hypothetical protein